MSNYKDYLDKKFEFKKEDYMNVEPQKKAKKSRQKSGQGKGETARKGARKITEQKKDKTVKKDSGQKPAQTNKNSICKVESKCGGCSFINIPYKEQLEFKTNEVRKIIGKFCKVNDIIGMENPFYYRNKVHAVFTHKKDGTIISGTYQEGTHFVVPIEKCMIENEKADEIMATIRRLVKDFKIKTYNEDTGYGFFRHVLIRVGHTSKQIMVVLVVGDSVFPSRNNFVKELLKAHEDITTVVMNINDKQTSMVLGESERVLYGKGYIEDTLCGKTFRISSKSFYQVNSVQTELLYNKAIEYAGLTGNETVFDAYCGIGTIGIIAADKAKDVIAVELNKDAVKDARKNAKMNNVTNIEFYNNDAGKFMAGYAANGGVADVVFMDPPRSGSDVAFMDNMLTLAPEKIVYVSCNPVTLARDLKYLTAKGYKAVEATPCDMFPMTNHVECVTLLQRENI